MDCRSCEKHINDYLDGTLTERKKLKFHEHLNRCEACKIALEQYRHTWDQLGDLETLSPGENFEAEILSKLKPYKVPEEERVLDSQRNKSSGQRSYVKDGILIFGYFITLFVVLSVLRNQVFPNVDWISGIVITARVFRDVFDGMIFRGFLSLTVVYPIRIFHWARTNFTNLSVEGRVLYSVVLVNLVLIGTFSHILLQKIAGTDKKAMEKRGSQR